jgi:plasmid maintenance system antidote protein VapI
LSIVEQIDEILQSLLEGTPLEERGIRLQEAPDGSVQVWIGLQRYDSVETVPDAEVRRVIQRAIKTWEQRHA